MLKPETARSPYMFPIRRPVTVTMIVLTVVVFGILSYRLLPVNMMPDITYPSLTVRTEYPGAAPEEVEVIATRPLEQALGVVRNLVEIKSSSRAEYSDILLEYDWDVDMNQATQEVREKLDMVFLPEDVKPPLILRYDPTLDPLLRIGLISDSLNLLDLRTLCEELIKQELSKLPGVAAVKVKGGEEDEINVSIDPQKLQLLNLSVEVLNQKLASENINIAGGRLLEGESEYIIRSLNEFKSIEDIGRIVIKTSEEQIVRLSDIAVISRKPQEKNSITRVSDKESVELEIYKESDANPITVSELVKKRFFGWEKKKAKWDKKGKQSRGGMKPLNEVLTDRIQIHVLADQADFIKLAVGEVRSAALVGGALAVLVLLLFLGRIVDTLIVALVIPVSLIGTFAAMHIAHVSLNIMSLGGLALGIGMMVDNAIVVIESIHRRRESGEDIETASVWGTKTVGGAVIASTLTTIVVFFPIVFVTGIAGQVFGDMALTVIISLTVSLIAALFFIPMLTTRKIDWGMENPETSGWLRPSQKPVSVWRKFTRGFKSFTGLKILYRILVFPIVITFLILRLITEFLFLGSHWMFFGELLLVKIIYKKFVFPFGNWIGSFGKTGTSAFQNNLDKITDFYAVSLSRIIRFPGIIFFTVLLLSVFSFFWIFPKMGSELIPAVSQGVFEAEFHLPIGTSLEKTASVIKPIEGAIARLNGVEKVSSRSGGDPTGAEQSTIGPNYAVMTVKLQSGGDIEARENLVVQKIRSLVSNVPSLDLLITHPTLFTFKQPVEIILKNDNLDSLAVLTKSVETELRTISGLTDIESSIRSGHPEVVVVFDRDRLAKLGISPRTAAERIRIAVQGRVPTRFREKEQRIDIRVQWAEGNRESLAQLSNLVINPDQKIPVMLSDVAEITVREGPAEIRHYSGTRSGVITAGVTGSDLKAADLLIHTVLNQRKLEEGFDYLITGQRREMKDSLGSLQMAMLLAIFLVYVVMASQFESLKSPFLILLTVPISIAAVIPVLWGMSMSLSVMVFLGLIVLVGIVVNNSIVLIDYINQLLSSGQSLDEAIIQSARARLRPILMTSLTTILALLPMAFGIGEGVEIRRPMAITVIFGLLFGTLVTLIVIPVFFRLVNRNHDKTVNLREQSS